MIRSLLVVLLLQPAAAFARGGGGCLLPGTLIETRDGPVPIESLHAGDVLPEGRVLAVHRLQAEGYREIRTGAGVLRATEEHPVEVAPGVFRLAGRLRAGDAVLTRSGGRTARSRIASVKVFVSPTPVFNLTVAPGEVFSAGGLSVHNKGCFLPDTPILDGNGAPVELGSIRPGDKVLAFTLKGEVVVTTVRQVFKLKAPDYFEITTERSLVKATAEHPFYAGDGTFKTVAALRLGDPVFLFDGKGLVRETLKGKRLVEGPVDVYNLQTDDPNTFFASRIAVHNKGGGCFAPGTRVRTPRGESPIESLAIGDEVLARDESGRTTVTRIRGVFRTQARLLEVSTEKGLVTTTAEHPFAVSGGFMEARWLKKGQPLVQLGPDGYGRPKVLGMRYGRKATVYNLEVGGPHSFIAEGFLVHNKGGGGGGFHSSSRGGGSSGPDYCDMARKDPMNDRLQAMCKEQQTASAIGSLATLVMIILIMGYAWYQDAHGASASSDEDLDFNFTQAQVQKKSGKTRKLLEFLARSDEAMKPEALVDRAKATFLKLQECWESREYGDMKPMLMEALYQSHCSQLEGMKRAHEIDRIADLKLHWIEPVHLRYSHAKEQREFSVLIEAESRDHYVDDRTGAFLRGDSEAATFQEFWTFQWEGDGWRLRQIEQTRESDALRDENFVEDFTPDQLGQIYGEAPGRTSGPLGTWQSEGQSGKETKVHRLLNFLVKTDKAWDEDAIRERARQVFMAVHAARETGVTTEVEPFLFPRSLASLKNEIHTRDTMGLQVLFRNLCIRKVELMLVRNFSDDGLDEFTARISAHAQKTVMKGAVTQFAQAYVLPYVEYWVFGRDGREWKLKEILPPAAGEGIVGAENLDQGVSADQLQWYYTQERAL